MQDIKIIKDLLDDINDYKKKSEEIKKEFNKKIDENNDQIRDKIKKTFNVYNDDFLNKTIELINMTEWYLNEMNKHETT
jgi:ElaB/YqjD/DUF883 family membrane-anchored ribosome-binding protein